MKKFLSFAVVAFAAVTFVACGNSAPKLEGTEVAKKYFTFIQPTGWEMEGNGADEAEGVKPGHKGIPPNTRVMSRPGFPGAAKTRRAAKSPPSATRP